MRSSNPHTGDYEEAREAFHRLDETLAAWMADNVRARIAEFDSDSERACEMLREAGELLLRGCEQYAVAREEVRGVILSTPRMNGQDLTEDERVHGWARLARELLDGGGSSPPASPQTASGRRRIMAEREGTAEDFAAMAAALRGQDMPSKREAERELIESIHPAEPNEGPGEDEVDYARRLLAPKPEHERIARLLHPEGE